MLPTSSTISETRSRAREEPVPARVRAQLENLLRKESAAGKPYYEVRLRDAGDSATLRAWSDSPAFDACRSLAPGDAVEVEGEFYWNGSFGLDAKKWTIRALESREAEELFAGPPEAREAAEMRFAELEAAVQTICDPRLLALCEAFLREFGTRFARAAAARQNHHARRGGLLEHTLQMMKSGDALCAVYPSLNRDLLLAGILFHDCGKLWETCPPADGFDIPREMRGELLGHISVGVELANTLWRTLPLDSWAEIRPPSEDVRLHLLHLIASHHGQLEFGSPVEPKTPEALALHHIDNIDARLEMFAAAYASSPEIAPGIRERAKPLGTNPVAPLPKFPHNE